MSQNQEKTSPPTQSNPTKNTSLFIVIALCGIALMAFFIGRRSAPPSNTTAGAQTEVVTHDEHAHGENEGDAHAEEHDEGEHGAEEIKFDGDAAKAAGIQVAPVSLGQAGGGIPFNGQIAVDPNGVVRVSSLVPGRVTRLYVSPGDTVQRGQTLAVVESRAIGEAQSAYKQAGARLQNARANLDVVLRQARAGVFSRGPVEVARKAQVEAQGAVRAGETAVRQAQVALDNALRLAKAGSFASPALEAARSQENAAEGALKSARAALDNAQASVEAAQSDLERRKQQAAAGTYQSRPVEEARRALASAKSARNAAQSEVATTRANLSRAKTLSAEGLISQRDHEAAQNAFTTATANVESAEADLTAAQSELERQQKLAATNVEGQAEVQQAQSRLIAARSDVRTRQAEVSRAEQGAKLSQTVLEREQTVFNQGIANRREVSAARGALEKERNDLEKARQTFALAETTLRRETRIFQQNLNNIAPVQTARANYVQAQSDWQAARTAISLLKAAPNGSASVPIVAPISGIVQERDVMQAEVLSTDAHLLTITNLSRVHIDLFLPERDMAQVRVGSPLRATVDALPGRTVTGSVELIHTEIDEKTRTVEAHADIANPGDLRIGMFVRGHIVISSGPAVVKVPAEAVQKMEEKTVVFVPADEPNTFVAREVETGATEDGQTVIKNGLKPGEKVVVKGAFMVKAQALKAELGHHH